MPGESLVQVTEGVGKKLHTFQRTIGANNVEDEVVLFGENYLASYVMNTIHNAAIVTTTANSHLLQIMAGASLKVRIRRIEMYQSVMATTAALLDLRVYRLTTAGTGGTVIGTAALDSAVDGAAGTTGMSLPTVKGTEGVALVTGMPYMMQTLGASTQIPSPLLVWDFDRPRSKPLIIPAGATNGIAIKNINAVAVAGVTFGVWFDETSF